ncbi:hypothetical protein C5C18_14110 [Rathayibacter tritici]|uniref:ADP-ribose pyrophosphatase n=1 Tax=Rathayibacter tritici TaxID=33888 RepID=A0A160KUW4_9MICO|nr:hypothetical protein [Rathayibacter tritici]AND17710.1 ADP-ribose pyrophosphatase [Rathayibacter tritici]PPF62958.1 hypothetical protein C5C21_13660 [Rathayibacter tritici]PPG04060.1 hypothetical protein C5C18_14110 [Rathayibacter tritici]PPI49163.1 hypothetical protein C5D18_01945 [Rathayibacter tritici]
MEAYGFVAQSVDVVLAEALTHGEHERAASEQDTQQQWFSEAEVEALVPSGAIVETATVAALPLFRLERGVLR